MRWRSMVVLLLLVCVPACLPYERRSKLLRFFLLFQFCFVFVAVVVVVANFVIVVSLGSDEQPSHCTCSVAVRWRDCATTETMRHTHSRPRARSPSVPSSLRVFVVLLVVSCAYVADGFRANAGAGALQADRSRVFPTAVNARLGRVADALRRNANRTNSTNNTMDSNTTNNNTTTTPSVATTTPLQQQPPQRPTPLSSVEPTTTTTSKDNDNDDAAVPFLPVVLPPPPAQHLHPKPVGAGGPRCPLSQHLRSPRPVYVDVVVCE